MLGLAGYAQDLEFFLTSKGKHCSKVSSLRRNRHIQAGSLLLFLQKEEMGPGGRWRAEGVGSRGTYDRRQDSAWVTLWLERQEWGGPSRNKASKRLHAALREH